MREYDDLVRSNILKDEKLLKLQTMFGNLTRMSLTIDAAHVIVAANYVSSIAQVDEDLTNSICALRVI